MSGAKLTRARDDPIGGQRSAYVLLDRLRLEVLLEGLIVKVALLFDTRRVLELEIAFPTFGRFPLALHLVLHARQLLAAVADPALEQLQTR